MFEKNKLQKSQAALIDLVGEDASYKLATDVLHILCKRGYCIWQTYTRQDIKANTGKKRLTSRDMERYQERISNFEMIND